jgi:hypothetical protein
MIIHSINDLSNKSVIKLLSDGVSSIKDELLIKNYHPKYHGYPGNLFTILEEHRYKKDFGTYYVIEDNNQYVCSAGWNVYNLQSDVALVLTRMYVNPKMRGNFFIGNNILPLCLKEVLPKFNNIWVSVNKNHRKMLAWVDRARYQSNVPDLYKKFSYIGLKEIYYTEQHVYAYMKDSLNETN